MSAHGIGSSPSITQNPAMSNPADSSGGEQKLPKDLEKAIQQLIDQIMQMLGKGDKGGAAAKGAGQDMGKGGADAGGGCNGGGGAASPGADAGAGTGAAKPGGSTDTAKGGGDTGATQGSGDSGSSKGAADTGATKGNTGSVDAAGSGKAIGGKTGAASGEDKTGMVAEINRIRAEHGLNPVKYDPNIAKAAERNDAESVRTGKLDHHFELDGYSGEATAYDPGLTAKSVVEGWANSSTHSGAVLDPNVKSVGGSINGAYATLGTSDWK